jgi:hypothetical protein
MAINPKKGFALLIAVVFVSVVLALGTALSSLAYKQQTLASGGARSQYAFYAADAALECALFEAQKNGCSDPYRYENYTPGRLAPCAGSSSVPGCGGLNYGGAYFQEICFNTGACPNQRVVKQMFPIAFPDPIFKVNGTETQCADVTVYETLGKAAGSTFVFAQGYDVPCSKVGSTNRIVARGLYAHF